MEPEKLAIFQGQKVRRIIHNNEWWFSIVDVCGVLADSPTPRQYWEKVKNREFADFQLSPNWGRLKMTAEDGKMRETDCANTEGIFRIVQSIPSPKAEPFKRWLARVGFERVQEIEDPELATKRTMMLYKAKGYSDGWIEKRMRGIAIREELTEEWQKREIRAAKEFAILTAEISKATFDMTPSQYKKYKGLERENLRDHMDGLELIFSMLGEASTTKIARGKDAIGFTANKIAAQKGGKIAGDARRQLEIDSNEKVINKSNYLTEPEDKKLLKE